MPVIASGTLNAGPKPPLASGTVSAGGGGGGGGSTKKKVGASAGKKKASGSVSAKKDSPPKRGVESADTRGGRREQDTLAATAGRAVSEATRAVGERPRIQARPGSAGTARELALAQEAWSGGARATAPIQRSAGGPALDVVPVSPVAPTPDPGPGGGQPSTQEWAKLLTSLTAPAGPPVPTGAFSTPRGTPGALQPGEIRGFHSALTPPEAQANQESINRGRQGFDMASASLANTEIGTDLGIQPTNFSQGHGPVSPTWEATRQQKIREAEERKDAKGMFAEEARDLTLATGQHVSPYDLYKHHKYSGYQTDLQSELLSLEDARMKAASALENGWIPRDLEPYLPALNAHEISIEDVEDLLYDSRIRTVEDQIRRLGDDPAAVMKELADQGGMSPAAAAAFGRAAGDQAAQSQLSPGYTAYMNRSTAFDQGKWSDQVRWTKTGPYIGPWAAVPGVGDPGPPEGMITKPSSGVNAPYAKDKVMAAWDDFVRSGFSDYSSLNIPKNELGGVKATANIVEQGRRILEDEMGPENYAELNATQSAFKPWLGQDEMQAALYHKFVQQQRELAEYSSAAGADGDGLQRNLSQQLTDRGLINWRGQIDKDSAKQQGLDPKAIEQVMTTAKSLDQKAATSAGFEDKQLIALVMAKNLAFGDLGGPGYKGRDKGRQQEIINALYQAHTASPRSRYGTKGMQLTFENQSITEGDENYIDSDN